MSKEFKFKVIDQEGMDTLEVVSEADNFNKWMYKTIKPYCSGRILEIGSGIGNISEYFLNNKHNITLSDIRENYCSILERKFADKSNLEDVFLIDIIDVDFDTKHKDLFGTFDSIYALNIVEHVKDDLQAIANCKKLLKENGNLIILVPAYQSLYNGFDKELEHYRRYTQASLNKIFTENKLKIIHQQYFNSIGILGWWFSGNILKKKTIPKGQMNIYNTLVPVFKIIDKIILNKTGLSVITVGSK